MAVFTACARTLQARTRLSQRPWRVDDFDAFAEVWAAGCDGARLQTCVWNLQALLVTYLAVIRFTWLCMPALQVWFSKSQLDADGQGEQAATEQSAPACECFGDATAALKPASSCTLPPAALASLPCPASLSILPLPLA